MSKIKQALNILAQSKRQKIILAAILITIGLLSTQMINFFFLRYRFILGLGILAYLLSLWVLWEGMNKVKAVMLMILPTMFTIASASFYFLLPIRWLTRLPVAILFGLSFYTLLLAQNVFNVSAQRTIPLYRAAQTASFLFMLITAFFLFNVIFALNLPFFWNGLAAFLITFPLTLQAFWTQEMEDINTQVLIYSLVVSAIVGEVALALSFWPLAPTIWSLFLASVIYVCCGIIIELMKDRFKKRVVLEFIYIAMALFIISFLVTAWE